eukprot:719372-Prorocentrum_minimum.AAC.2
MGRYSRESLSSCDWLQGKSLPFAKHSSSPAEEYSNLVRAIERISAELAAGDRQRATSAREPLRAPCRGGQGGGAGVSKRN